MLPVLSPSRSEIAGPLASAPLLCTSHRLFSLSVQLHAAQNILNWDILKRDVRSPRMSRGLQSPPYKKLRRLLVQARADAGLTQLQVAERMKRPQSFVSKYENGERQLDVIEFVSVCKAIGVPPSDLVGELA